MQFVTDLARESGKLLCKYYNRGMTEPKLKADHSLVTQADRAADELILQSIQKKFPQDVIISEELNPSFSKSTSNQEVGNVWVIDPLDGTTNFSLGLHYWGTLITRVEGGWPVQTVMYFPSLDEIFTAQKGKGAFLNGQRIQVEPPNPDRPASFFACCSRTFRNYEVKIPYKTRILGSAAYSLSAVARGVALIGFEATPRIWDIAGPWLLVNEAGGVIDTLDGSEPFPLATDKDYSRLSFPTLAAAMAKIADKARRQIKPRQQA